MRLVSPLRRWLCIPVGALTALAGFGPWVDYNSYSSPVFDTFRDLMPLRVWGVVWLTAAMMLTMTSVTGRLRTYVGGHAVALTSATFWILVLFKARFVDELDVPATSFGLWVFPIGYCIVVLAIPITYFDSRPRG